VARDFDPTADPINTAVVSPDGSYIAVATGRECRLFDTVIGRFIGISFAHRG